MLFDVEGDPHEQVDLANTHPDVCRQANYLLNGWHDEMMQTMDSAVDPLWTVIREGGPLHARGQLKSYCEFLENTERAYAIEALKKEHPREFGVVINPLDYANDATMQSYVKKLTKKLSRG
jgi:choline-sulfatase